MASWNEEVSIPGNGKFWAGVVVAVTAALSHEASLWARRLAGSNVHFVCSTHWPALSNFNWPSLTGSTN
jgi:hypothetical protein